MPLSIHLISFQPNTTSTTQPPPYTANAVAKIGWVQQHAPPAATAQPPHPSTPTASPALPVPPPPQQQQQQQKPRLPQSQHQPKPNLPTANAGATAIQVPQPVQRVTNAPVQLHTTLTVFQ